MQGILCCASMAETVLYEAADGVATLTLNRPDRLNTIGPELIDDLRAMLERAWTDAGTGCPPARVWGSPTTSMWIYRLGLERAKRLLLTGDALDGRRAVEWGLASDAVPEAELDEAALGLARRVALLPANQLHMMKLLVNQAYEQMGLRVTQLIGTLLDGSARHTPEGVDFTRRALADGVGRAITERDAPFGDYGQDPGP